MSKTTVSNHTPDSLVKHFDAILSEGSHLFAHSSDGPIHLLPVLEAADAGHCCKALGSLLSAGRLENFSAIRSSGADAVIGFLALRSPGPGRTREGDLQGGCGSPVPAA